MIDGQVKEEILLSKDRIFDEFYDTELYQAPFRFALEIYHRILFKRIPLRSPSLELGISNGISSSYIFSDQGCIDWGSDMPDCGVYSSNILESHGAVVQSKVTHYKKFIGADGQNIPFPDNSFATVVCNEVLGQGMDRLKMLSEMIRVLAPGGIIAFTENTSELTRFPPLLKRIEQYNPYRGTTVGESWYKEQLNMLGMENIWSCNFMRSTLGVALLYLLFSAKLQPPAINEPESSLYHLYLESLLPAIEEELIAPENTRDGLHLFVSACKPGKLSSKIPIPEPFCPECKQYNFSVHSDKWICSNSLCTTVFDVINGVPILVTKNLDILGDKH